MRGIHISIPFTSAALWVEWRDQSVGFGFGRGQHGDREFFLGRLQGVFSPYSQRT